ncbi:MAG: hypothetical protein KF751_05790 [Nitrospira sp.]|nr:hypothetical protein [Nitrospira sp.]MBX3347566.1 hypothetical protein [Nitrospira sp.]
MTKLLRRYVRRARGAMSDRRILETVCGGREGRACPLAHEKPMAKLVATAYGQLQAKRS